MHRAEPRPRFVPEARVFYRITNSSRLSYIGQSNSKLEAQFASMKLQIGYLRSMKDDERVRAACVTYLQTWLPHFYPNRADILEAMQELAKALGGRLEIPKLSWKYAWIQKTLGWDAAKAAQLRYNLCKGAIFCAWDNAAFHWERRFTGAGR